MEETTDDEKMKNDVNNKLLLYSSSGQTKLLSKLMQENILEINFQDEKGNTALHSACYFDEIEAVKIILSHKQVNLTIRSNRGDSVLHTASNSNSINCLQYLCDFIQNTENSSLLNSFNNWHETPLHLASASGNVESVKILCENGASTKIKDNWNRTALRVALENGEKKIVQLLEQYCDEETIKEANEKFNENSTEITAPSLSQQKLIQEMNNRKDMHKPLDSTQLENLVKVTHTFDVKGKVVENQKPTVKMEPVFQKKESLSKLFEYGTCPRDLNHLHELILDEKIDVNGKDYYGWNALQKSILWGKFEYVGTLLSVMSSEAINEIGGEGQNAFHIAVQSTMEMENHPEELLNLFTSCDKVDPTVKDFNGFTSFEIAMNMKASEAILSVLDKQMK